MASKARLALRGCALTVAVLAAQAVSAQAAVAPAVSLRAFPSGEAVFAKWRAATAEYLTGSSVASNAATPVNHLQASTSGGAVAHPAIKPLVSPAWSIQEPPEASGSTEGVLAAVSCSAESACTAVGHYHQNGGTLRLLAERFNGTTWSLQTAAEPAGSITGQLNGVSCPSATNCIAVGSSVSATDQGEALAERWNGTAWASEVLPKPATAPRIALSAVSCSSTTSCVAVGYFYAGSEYQPLAESFNGTKWTVEEPPHPTEGSGGLLHAVSCFSSSACTAVGVFVSGSPHRVVPLAERWNGTSWSAEEPTVVPAGATTESGLWGVSCPTATACIASGKGPKTASLVETWSGGSWTAAEPATPTGTTWGMLKDVSCTSTTACVGAGFDQPTKAGVAPLADILTGTEWSGEQMPNASGSRQTEIEGISCTGTTACIAVGYDDTTGAYKPLAEASH
jgi:hypothetical protein